MTQQLKVWGNTRGRGGVDRRDALDRGAENGPGIGEVMTPADSKGNFGHPDSIDVADVDSLMACYADSSLPTGMVSAAQARLATDPAARITLGEYQAIDRRLRTPMPLPAVNWDQFAEQISAAVFETSRPRVAGRIGVTDSGIRVSPAGRIGRSWWVRPAAAAAVMLAAGAGLWTWSMSHVATVTPVVDSRVAVRSPMPDRVVGPHADSASGPIVAEVSIGPSKALAARGDAGHFAIGDNRPPKVTLAGDLRVHGKNEPMR